MIELLFDVIDSGASRADLTTRIDPRLDDHGLGASHHPPPRAAAVDPRVPCGRSRHVPRP